MSYEEKHQKIKKLLKTIDVAKVEINHQSNKVRQAQNKIDELKVSVREEMLADGLVDDAYFQLKRSPVKCVVHDVDALPERFQKVKIEANKKELLAYLKEEDAKGNRHNFATLERGEDVLVVK
jgi:hypothetical protein